MRFLLTVSFLLMLITSVPLVKSECRYSQEEESQDKQVCTAVTINADIYSTQASLFSWNCTASSNFPILSRTLLPSSNSYYGISKVHVSRLDEFFSEWLA